MCPPAEEGSIDFGPVLVKHLKLLAKSELHGGQHLKLADMLMELPDEEQVKEWEIVENQITLKGKLAKDYNSENPSVLADNEEVYDFEGRESVF